MKKETPDKKVNKLKQKTRFCPTCLGSGFVKFGKYAYYTDSLREKARGFYRKGFSYREVGKKLGIAGSAQKIKSLIEAKTL